MKIIKRVDENYNDTSIIFECNQWTDELDTIYGYIEGRYRTITAYGDDKEMVNLRIDKILYFEAVGEHVFAYTKNNVYEIKMRLYQVESMVETNKIYKASKSILINIRKIASVKPALNGRMYAQLINGEEVLISRGYAKQIVEYIKSA